MDSRGFQQELLAAGQVKLEFVGDSIVTVKLARPEAKNAQTPAMWRALAHIAQIVSDSAEIRAVILSGQGQSFSAGLDKRMFAGGIEGEIPLPNMASMGSEEFHVVISEYQQAFVQWRNIPQVVVAAVQGYAIGAGFQLALGADIVLAADDVRFSMKETQLGLVPDLGGTKPLVDKAGYAAALEICLTGRWVQAAEAKALGIAQHIFPAEDLHQETQVFVSSLITAMPSAQFETKKLLAGYAQAGAIDQQQQERSAQNRRIRELARLLQG